MAADAAAGEVPARGVTGPDGQPGMPRADARRRPRRITACSVAHTRAQEAPSSRQRGDGVQVLRNTALSDAEQGVL